MQLNPADIIDTSNENPAEIKTIDKIKRWLWNVFLSGFPTDYDLDVLRKILLLNILNIFGCFFLILLGVIEFILRGYLLGISDVSLFLLLMLFFIYLRKTGNHHLVSWVGTIVAGLYFFFLIANGGIGHTAYVWAFLYPLISISLLGTKRGAIFSLLLLVMACFVFIFGTKVPFFISYSRYLKIRFIPAYLAVCIFCFVIEKIQEIIQYRLKSAKSEVEKTVGELKKVNAALEEGENKYRTFFKTSRDCVFITSIDGRVVDFNDVAVKFFGYDSKEELRQLKMSDIYADPKDREEHIKVNMQQGFTKEYPLKLKKKDGSIINTLVTMVPKSDGDGNFIGFQGTIRDITEQKRAADKLRESEKKYRNILERIEDGYFEVDIAGNFTFYNQAMSNILGYKDNELMGMNNRQYMDSENAKNVYHAFNHVYKTGESYKALGWDLIRKDGTICNVETSISLLKDEKDQPIGFKGIARDVSERKKYTKTLQESEARYRLLADNVSDNIWIFDLETMRFTYVSPSVINILGYTAEEATELQLRNILTPSSLELANNVLEEELIAASQNFDPSRSRILEFEQYRRNGSTVWTEVVMKFIYGNKQQPIAILGVTRDISERKRLQNELVKSQKMESIGLLASGVAHDLNNVLSGIVSYPELILMGLPGDSKLRKPMKTIMESGNKAVEIVQDLLTIARGVSITKEPINLNDLVTDYLDSPEFKKLKPLYPGVTFKADLAQDLFNIDASKIHIRKAVMNLVENAAEAVEESGNVSISTVNRYLDKSLRGFEKVDVGEYAVLSIADDGPGISSKDLQRIFEPFYTKKKMGRSGTGLGLSVVWNVIRDHKGYVDVKTDADSTVFELYFPISRDAVLKKDTSVSVESYKGKGETILVVDDIESQREISCRMLDILGYKCYAAASGKEAVEYLQQNSVDLVLLDMIMEPGLNGYETYERIIQIHPGQKAVILSGFSETDDVKKTQAIGAGKYIKKPVTLEKIGLAIKEELKK